MGPAFAGVTDFIRTGFNKFSLGVVRWGMNRHLHFIFPVLLLLAASVSRGQGQPQSEGYTRLFRVYEDNDFLNIKGNGTDNAYTNGTRFDLFYTKKHPSHSLVERLLPRAGDSSLNIFGWSLMQIMVTPNDISKTYDQPDDYPYCGALFATHSLYSYNAKKNYSFQTELVAGIRGPASFAEQSQKAIHGLINYQKPMGWQNQLSTSPLVNINFTAEKKLIALTRYVELIGGAKLSGGSMLDAFMFYPLFRIGKMNPYFDGYFSQYSSSGGKGKKTQFYLFFQPKTSFVLHNSLVYGSKPDAVSSPLDTISVSSERRIRHRLEDISFGGVFSHKNFSIVYTQTHSTEYNKGLYRHNVGNISLYFSW